MAEQTVRILDGNTFVVCDERGDVEASPTEPTGLFSFDTRFLSRWVLTIDGQKLNSLSIDDLQYFESRFFLVPGTGTVYIDAKLSVIRERAVGDGFHEELTILNHQDEPVDLVVRIDAASDFADLFEVKDALKKVGSIDSRVDEGRLHLRYTLARHSGETVISSSAAADIDDGGWPSGVRSSRRQLDHGSGRQ
jgi:glycogen debranching enzyme